MTEKELMLTALLECVRTDLYADPQPLTSSHQRRLEDMQYRRQKGEPLQYILGCCEFFGMKFFVDSRVLIPRPETELLVEQVLNKVKFLGRYKNSSPLMGEVRWGWSTEAKYPFYHPPLPPKADPPQAETPPIQGGEASFSILELGTGSGNIAISLAKFLPFSEITSVDVSRDALESAKDNALFHLVRDKINFVHQDMADYFKSQGEKLFDIIVSNPPYIAHSKLNSLPEDVRREPRIALDGGENGLDFYKIIIPKAARLLKREGFLFLEIGEDQQRDIENIFKECDFYQNIEFLKDYCGKDRMIIAQAKG